MRIGIIVARMGGEDGVALEVDKWIDVLHRKGHQIYIIAGQYERSLTEAAGAVHARVPVSRQTLEPAMSFSADPVLEEQQRAFLKPDGDEQYMQELLNKNIAYLRAALLGWIAKCKLDLVITENANALPLHLSLGIAIKQALEESGIRAISHDHDYYWERGDRYRSPYPSVQEHIADAYPLLLPQVRHAVINTAARDQLQQKFNREAVIVPNVMDFSQPYGVRTPHNSRFLSDLGLNPERDCVLLQVTRIVRRKGIEIALELIHRLKNPACKLIITGSEGDTGLEGDTYLRFLHEKIVAYGIQDQVIFAAPHIAMKRGTHADGRRVYELSDVYAAGHACCYFSHYEGFGNAFVEAVCARRPIFVNNYKPVYWPEIGSKGFKTVQIEDGVLTDEAVAAITAVLFNKSLRDEIAEFNFELGKKEFSYEVLDQKLSLLLS